MACGEVFRYADGTMALNFAVLCPKIERVISNIERAYQRAPGLILTEEDLRCILFSRLNALPDLNRVAPTQDRFIRGSHVHTEITWFDANGLLSIRPDITILEPGHLSILHGYEPLLGAVELERWENPPWQSSPQHQRQWQPEQPKSKRTIELFKGAGSSPSDLGAPSRNRRSNYPLPSKQFAFGGKAINIELKFARRGIDDYTLGKIKAGYRKMKLLFEILDERGEGDAVFSYLIIFNKYEEDPDMNGLGSFLRSCGSSHRHKVIYKTGLLHLEDYL